MKLKHIFLMIAGMIALVVFTTFAVTWIVQIFRPGAFGVTDASSTSIVLPPTSNEVEAAINGWRTKQGLAAFNSEVPALDKAAQARAEGMCKENDWSHAKDWQVLDQYYSYSYAGENLYYGSLQKDQVSDAITTWANSPSHLENMVADYSQVGIGVKACPGFQGSDDAVIITNYFGVPR